MDNENKPQNAASGEGKSNHKPHHKRGGHHRRPQAEHNIAAENSSNGTINVRPGRYDLPPEAAAREDKPAIDHAQGEGEQQPKSEHSRSRRPRRRGRGGQKKDATVEQVQGEVELTAQESAPEKAEKPEKKERPPKKQERREDAAENVPAAPEAVDDAPAEEGDQPKKRRSRSNRRRGGRGRNRRENAEVQEAIEESGEVSEYIASAGIGDSEGEAAIEAEIRQELNSTAASDEPYIPEPEPVPAEPAEPLPTIEIIGVRFKAGGKTYYFDPAGEPYAKGTAVIVETARGMEYGTVEIANRQVPERDVVLPLRPVVRRATEEDTVRYNDNLSHAAEAFEICARKIEDHKLEMKLVDVEYTFDNSKLLFYFTADGRVDFRELVKDLASVFRTRIELRQIGIRDETKLLGGIGICGRPFCCKTFLNDFVQVSIKMAKEQNLSLNSVKISGACGRLMCCLRYEYDTYQEEIRKTPKCDQIVATPEGDGTVIEVQPLAGLVRVRFSDKPDAAPKVFHRDQVKVIGGKGFKPPKPEPAPAPEALDQPTLEPSETTEK
ncbi:MAG: stage 0 sporulation family protein [Clostridia bacterium]|nr:stage 0 sporulation family protein [Clostridia bacterium]